MPGETCCIPPPKNTQNQNLAHYTVSVQWTRHFVEHRFILMVHNKSMLRYWLLLTSMPSIHCSLTQWMYLCSFWTWSHSSSPVAAGQILNNPIVAFSPCDRIQSSWMLRVLPGSPSEPPKILFCSPGVRANCLVSKTLVVISSARQGWALLGEHPNPKFAGQSEFSFNLSC